MLIFIFSSLGLCLLVQAASPLQAYLISPQVYYFGMGIAVASMLGRLSNRLPSLICYDIFSAATLLIWFSAWKPEFKDDSPMFFAYPLYFVFAASLMALYLIAQADKIDKETLLQMERYLGKTLILQPWLLMPCILASLEWQEQYLLYPTAMTLLIAQAAFNSCLRRKPA